MFGIVFHKFATSPMDLARLLCTWQDYIHKNPTHKRSSSQRHQKSNAHGKIKFTSLLQVQCTWQDHYAQGKINFTSSPPIIQEVWLVYCRC